MGGRNAEPMREDSGKPTPGAQPTCAHAHTHQGRSEKTIVWKTIVWKNSEKTIVWKNVRAVCASQIVDFLVRFADPAEILIFMLAASS